MKTQSFYNSFLVVLLVMLTTSLTSCSVIGDLMKGSFYAGIFVVLAVIALIIWLITRAGRR